MGIFPKLSLGKHACESHSAKHIPTRYNSNLLSSVIAGSAEKKTRKMDAREYLYKFAGGAVTMEKDPTRGVAIITLDHPEKRNAISGRMMVELHDHIKTLEMWDEGKACILQGNGGNFSSGGDLNFARDSGTPEGASVMNTWMNDTLSRLSALKMFSVCYADGPTLGGGTEIALACDFILVNENVRFGLVHGKLGIVTAWGGGTRLTQRIGRHKALDLLLSARILSAKECVDIGIAQEIIPSMNINNWLDIRLQHHYTVTRAFKEITTLPSNIAQSEERRIFLPFWGGELNKAALNKRVKHVTATTNDDQK